MRHLLTEHAEVLGSDGKGIVSKIEGALDFTEKLLDASPLFQQANPAVAERLKRIKAQNKHYLAHEFFNKDWHPMHFATIAEWLEPAKLQYGCSANYIDHIDALNLTEAQQNFIKEIPDRGFRESVRDFMVNQQFRRDYWIKGVRNITKHEQMEGLRALRVVLTSNKKDINLKVNGALGEAEMLSNMYDPVLDVLGDHSVKTIAELELAIQGKSIGFFQLISVLMVLVGKGHLDLAKDEQITAEVLDQSSKVNAFICGKARSSNDISFLVSPVTGGGIPVTKFQQMFILAYIQGSKKPAEWAQYAWGCLQAQSEKLVKEGKPIESEAENIQELNQQALEFQTEKLNLLKALKIL